ncbi:MAG TPA: TonB-dependent receptor [Pseudoxanthomonas sp.]|nr:TonB-dependent receptor [Pseudoxanthomonas sp.]
MKSGHSLRQKYLIAAIGSLLAAGTVHGQSTVGSIYGQVPAGEGQSIVIHNTATGATREIAVGSNGRYTAGQLPVGTYTVTLQRDGKAVQTQENVVLRVGQGENVSFSGGGDNVQQLDQVTVRGSRAGIDVTSVDSRTVLTSEQLKALPLARSAEAAALLAPGVVPGTTSASGKFGAPLSSFGGASVVENVYYVNGFNTTDPNQGQGGLTLPYGAIDQEEIYTGGYSAKYGRSEGGVLNIVGKSGTNEWKFGGSMVFFPSWSRASQDDLNYTRLPVDVEGNPTPQAELTGMLYSPRSENESSTTTYDAYIGGPILRDRLFFFVAAEQSRSDGTSVGTVTSDNFTKSSSTNDKLYAKVNWNITDNHLLELTGDYNQIDGTSTQYHYDFVNRQRGEVQRDAAGKVNQSDSNNGGRFWAAKYTGYLTDSLTLSAQYGRMDLKSETIPLGLDTTNAFVGGVANQNPAYTGGTPIRTVQQIPSTSLPGEFITKNWRIDLNWVLGRHTLNFGVDRLDSTAQNINSNISSGPGYTWSYGHTSSPSLPLNPSIGIPATAGFPNGGDGYYVTKNVRRTGGNLYTYQQAEYLEDNWQVTDKLLLSLGIRHDSYRNENTHHDVYVEQDNLWQPRFGFSWDVHGDSSLKVFGNLGRYDMNQPLSSDGWLANSALNTTQYFTYGGIAANGEPTGLTQMTEPVSINGSYGQSPDFHLIYAKDLKPQAQDELILGFVKAIGSHNTFGAKFTHRELRSVIDDFCNGTNADGGPDFEGRAMGHFDKAEAMGIEVDYEGDPWCRQINPGIDNVIVVKDTSGVYHDVPMTAAEMGFPKLKRKYNGVDFFVEHAFDGKWYGKFDYTWSRAYGNSEGQSQTRSDSIGGTQQTDWDNPAVMVNANGPYGYDHTHQIKLFGYYQLTPEWQVSGNLMMVSGGPKYCLGKFGPDQTEPYGYGGFYWCDGQWEPVMNDEGELELSPVAGTGRPTPPGKKGRMGWNNSINLGVHYRPAFADHKLAFHFDVFNLFNEQTALNRNWSYSPQDPEDGWARYQMPTNTQAPRSARFSITYDY